MDQREGLPVGHKAQIGDLIWSDDQKAFGLVAHCTRCGFRVICTRGDYEEGKKGNVLCNDCAKKNDEAQPA